MRAKICRNPSCNRLIKSSETYCIEHLPPKREPFNYQGLKRNNEGLYNTVRWRKLRKKKIDETAFCGKCGSINKLHVHHIIKPLGDEELFYNYDNLDVLCETCHRVETIREMNKKRRKYA